MASSRRPSRVNPSRVSRASGTANTSQPIPRPAGPVAFPSAAKKAAKARSGAMIELVWFVIATIAKSCFGIGGAIAAFQALGSYAALWISMIAVVGLDYVQVSSRVDGYFLKALSSHFEGCKKPEKPGNEGRGMWSALLIAIPWFLATGSKVFYLLLGVVFWASTLGVSLWVICLEGFLLIAILVSRAERSARLGSRRLALAELYGKSVLEMIQDWRA